MAYLVIGVVGEPATIAGWVVAGGCLSIIAAFTVRSMFDSERRARLWLLMRRRSRRVELAALEAAEDVPAFEPERIRGSVSCILERIDAIWLGEHPAAPGERRDELLLQAWARSRQAEVGADARITNPLKVELLRIVNRPGESEDRVVARVRIAARRPSGLPPRKVYMEERWTLARHGEDWFLSSVAGDPLAGPVLSAPLIPSPAADLQRLSEASLSELTQRPAVATDAGALVDPALSPPLRLLDLSLADERFSPALIAAAIAHIIDAWEEASDGPSDPLEAVASTAAVDSLLHPNGPGSQRFLLDPVLHHWEVLSLDAGAQPASVVVSVRLSAATFEADENFVTTTDRTQRPLTLTWTLELQDNGNESPRWRLAAAGEP